MQKLAALIALALVASIAFSTAIDAPAARTLAFDSAHLRNAVEGIPPSGIDARDAGTVLLGENPIEGRHGVGACLGVLSRGPQVVVSYDPLCGVCGDGRLTYSWTSAPSAGRKAQERLAVSCRTDLLVIASDPAFDADAASGQGSALRTSLRNYFDALAADGITARWLPLSDLRSQEAMAFDWSEDKAGALKKVLKASRPAMVLFVGDFPQAVLSQAQASNPRVVFAKLPLGVGPAAEYFARAAQARTGFTSSARPVVVEYCGADRACKATSNALAGMSGAACPSAYCVSSLPQESLADFVSRLRPASTLFLVSPPDWVTGTAFRNAVIVSDSQLDAGAALENGALAVVAPRGLGFDWWKQGASGSFESAGFTGPAAAMVFVAGDKPLAESVQLAQKTTSLFPSAAGTVRAGSAAFRQERSALSSQLAAELDFYGDPAVGLDSAGVAMLRGGA